MVDVTPATFRAAFPPFTSPTWYPDPQIQFSIDEAYLLFRPCRYGSALNLAVMYFVAHQLTLGRQAAIMGAAGAPPGAGIGVQASKAVGDVSTSYNASVGLVANAGYFNLTFYGQQLYQRFISLAGMGPIQV